MTFTLESPIISSHEEGYPSYLHMGIGFPHYIFTWGGYPSYLHMGRDTPIISSHEEGYPSHLHMGRGFSHYIFTWGGYPSYLHMGRDAPIISSQGKGGGGPLEYRHMGSPNGGGKAKTNIFQTSITDT